MRIDVNSLGPIWHRFCQRYGELLVENRQFSLPPLSYCPLRMIRVTPFKVLETLKSPETIVFHGADREDFAILGCIV